MNPALSVQPFNKTIEDLMRYNNDRVHVVCPNCKLKEWEKLDAIRKPINDSHLVICRNCGFITYTPQLKNIQNWYIDEVRPQSVGFVNTKFKKLEYHDRLIFKYLKINPIKKKNFKVLDYGCSDGYVLKKFKEIYKKNVTVTGVEINKGHANWAKYIEELNITTNPNINELEGKFDIIMIYHVLEHIQKPDAFLKNIYAKLNEGGLLYVALPTINRLDYPSIESLFKDEHVNVFSDQYLELFIKNQGFQKEFFDNTLYGTCMIFKKSKPCEVSIRMFDYHIDLLGRINKAYHFKNEAEKDTRNMNTMREYYLEGLKVYDNFPELIIKTSNCMDPLDKEDFLLDYIEKKSHLISLKLHYGLELYKEQDLEKSEEVLLDFLTHGEDIVALAHIAYIHYHQKNVKKCIEYLQKILKLQPYDNGTFNILCNIVAQL